MLVFPILLVFCSTAAAESQDPREGREMSVFTVVRFPNEVCTSASGLNGTCYTASECTSRSGSASGSCASSFGVCCVFTLSCGATTSQNNTYATISTFSTTSDTDPCTYTYCKCSTDVCKLRKVMQADYLWYDIIKYHGYAALWMFWDRDLSYYSSTGHFDIFLGPHWIIFPYLWFRVKRSQTLLITKLTYFFQFGFMFRKYM